MAATEHLLSLPLRAEAVAQTVGPDRCGRLAGSAWVGRQERGHHIWWCDCVRAFSGRYGGELVAVDLGEVVGHHQ
jgi:hypothetical protein